MKKIILCSFAMLCLCFNSNSQDRSLIKDTIKLISYEFTKVKNDVLNDSKFLKTVKTDCDGDIISSTSDAFNDFGDLCYSQDPANNFNLTCLNENSEIIWQLDNAPYMETFVAVRINNQNNYLLSIIPEIEDIPNQTSFYVLDIEQGVIIDTVYCEKDIYNVYIEADNSIVFVEDFDNHAYFYHVDHFHSFTDFVEILPHHEVEDTIGSVLNTDIFGQLLTFDSDNQNCEVNLTNGIITLKKDFNNIIESELLLSCTVSDKFQSQDISINILKEMSLNETQHIVSFYPNPASNTIRIFQTNTTFSMLQIFDVSGKLLVEKKLTENEEILDVSTFSNGVYFFNFSVNEVSEMQKIIINR